MSGEFPQYERRGDLSVVQAAGELGISARSVQNLITRGELAAWVLHADAKRKRYRIPASAIDTFRERHAVTTAAPRQSSREALAQLRAFGV